MSSRVADARVAADARFDQLPAAQRTAFTWSRIFAGELDRQNKAGASSPARDLTPGDARFGFAIGRPGA